MEDFFYGWYFKCQSDSQTLAVIPAIHQRGRKCTCSIQFITENKAWTVTFPKSSFFRTGEAILIGRNYFGEDGIRLNIKTNQIEVRGEVSFGRLQPIKYSIMGPFSRLPFMECKHEVRSMLHRVSGELLVNGQTYFFQNARGYWEGDSGRSFPRRYVWTQCFFDGGSLMLSVADIPMGKLRFTGIIGIVLWKGKEYRIATYLGAKASHIRNKSLAVVQGDLTMEAWLLKAQEQNLRAPRQGDMVRTIRESVTCRARYRFRKGRKTLFSFVTEQASFEYEYPF